jgi:Prenyltransferase and squalene oxidase repeat
VDGRQDLRYTVRTLFGAPTFTRAAVATLAIGIGATTPSFSTVLADRTESAAKRDAVQRGLDLLERSAQQWHAGCVSCHHQALQAATADAARTRGFHINESFLHDQQGFIQRDVAKSRTRMLEAISSAHEHATQVGPNPDMIFGYSLFGLAQTRVRPSPISDTAVRYLLLLQDNDGNWQSWLKQRPPFEASDFAATALVVRAIREYAPSDRKSEAQKAIAAAVTWLNRAEPLDTEDRAFRLLGLHWGRAGRDPIQDAGRDLLAKQRSDGGWAQIDTLASDGYATGESLLALRTAGVVRPGSSQFQNGIDFLLRTQHADGSWYVKSRAKPVQQYFETGFPYGTHQFISYTATCWAILAILSNDASREGAVH